MNVDSVGMLSDNCLLELSGSKDVSTGGIIIPDPAKDAPQTAKVIAVGPGRTEEGIPVQMTVEPGDTVVFAKYSGSSIELNDKSYLIVRERDLLAILRGVSG